MSFEWAVTLGALGVIVLFVVWVARRTGQSGKHSSSPTHSGMGKDSPSPANPELLRPTVTEAHAGPLPQNGRRFHARLLTDSYGSPIGSENRDAWLRARRNGVTATDVGRIVRPDGHFSTERSTLLEAKVSGGEDPFLPVFQHGIDREPIIAAWVAEAYGIQFNSLLCRGENPRHLATPDGIGAGGVIAEIKTSSEPLKEILGRYRDQLQWQLHVTQSERVLFVVENRFTFRRESQWIERDDYRIFILAAHADAFLQELDKRLATADLPVQEPTPVLSRNAAARPDAASADATTDPTTTAARSSAPPGAVPPPSGKLIIRRQENVLPPETIVGSTDPDNDADDNRSWPAAEIRRLLQLYSDNEDMEMTDIARHFRTTSRAVVIALTDLVLEPRGPLEDPMRPKWKQPWTQNEVDLVHDLFRSGASLHQIAQATERDQLWVAFRLFEHRLPDVAEAIELQSA